MIWEEINKKAEINIASNWNKQEKLRYEFELILIF